ncbi:hypothetical protein HPP92_022281 [Vanilla planifolia]|uniref:Uncharacterized protein n=1 Tax=Vanilla planifolia TaxID=51239 RepID=A0A835PT16_VANPL|nr:hypothetical protein HPP92_022281 [Vanilla planifolia]
MSRSGLRLPDLESYIVYLGGYSNQAERLLTQPNELVRKTHVELLESHLKSKENAKDAIFYSYTRHINGFAAILDEEVALAISSMGPSVCSMILLTRRGKLIGTRSFFKGFESYFGNLSSDLRTPRDTYGHGTHTLSIAGGSPVPGANVLGFGNGTAKGGSPRARVAAYKVFWPYKDYGSFGFDADILAAFDAAIYDGVDVLSVSLSSYSTNYFDCGIPIGAFHAILNGISVVASAGNSGPDLGTVKNVAPWLLTVGASTIDRDFPAYVIFGKHKLKGKACRMHPAANASYEDANVCLMGSLDATKVRGKIVVCVRGWNHATDKSAAVKLVGGKGMVLVNNFINGNNIVAKLHVLPATHISDSDALKLFSYLNSTKSPMGTISYPITMLGTKPAPSMAPFSSQGPNTITPEILKPDIIAPGVNIIAAYTMATSPTHNEFDKRRLPFNILSGTSMSCPHIAGIVSLLKALHPNGALTQSNQQS